MMSSGGVINRLSGDYWIQPSRFEGVIVGMRVTRAAYLRAVSAKLFLVSGWDVLRFMRVSIGWNYKS